MPTKVVLAIMQVMRQSIAFLHKTSIMVSSENPGAGQLAQEMNHQYPELRTEPPPNFSDATLHSCLLIGGNGS